MAFIYDTTVLPHYTPVTSSLQLSLNVTNYYFTKTKIHTKNCFLIQSYISQAVTIYFFNLKHKNV